MCGSNHLKEGLFELHEKPNLTVQVIDLVPLQIPTIMENEDQKTVFEKHLDENATTLLSMTPAVATDLQMMCGPCAIYKPTKTPC